MCGRVGALDEPGKVDVHTPGGDEGLRDQVLAVGPCPDEVGVNHFETETG